MVPIMRRWFLLALFDTRSSHHGLHAASAVHQPMLGVQLFNCPPSYLPSHCTCDGAQIRQCRRCRASTPPITSLWRPQTALAALRRSPRASASPRMLFRRPGRRANDRSHMCAPNFMTSFPLFAHTNGAPTFRHRSFSGCLFLYRHR